MGSGCFGWVSDDWGWGGGVGGWVGGGVGWCGGGGGGEPPPGNESLQVGMSGNVKGGWVYIYFFQRLKITTSFANVREYFMYNSPHFYSLKSKRFHK